MKPVTRIAVVAAFASALGACASDPYYSQNRYYRTGPNYAYSQPAYAYSQQPVYYSSAPAYPYRTTTYTTYSQPQPQVYYSQPRNSYDGYWDYQRNYRGIGASPELSRM